MASKESLTMKTLKLVAIVLSLLAFRSGGAWGQTLTTLWSFSGDDGAAPYDGLVQGSDGNFYGTAYVGGASTNCFSDGNGTVVRVSPSGSLTTLHSFTCGTDGSSP